MDRAVVVLLRRRNVILEATRDDRPGGVDDAERAVAFGDAADHDTESKNIGKLLEADRFPLHLAPNRIGPLSAAGDLGGNTAVGEFSGELLLDFGDPTLAAGSQRLQPLGDNLVGVGIELAERQVLELFPHLLHAHAAGERRIDVERLLCRHAARLGRAVFERAHVVQPVGKLDQQHTHVVGDGQQKLAQVFGLLGLFGDEVELFQLGQTFDQGADVAAEQAVDLGAGGVGILDGIVQQRGSDGGVVEVKIGEDGGNLERMREIRIARGALLLTMRPHRVDIGAIEQILVGLRIVLLDAVDQLELPKKPRSARLLRRRFVVARRQIGCARDRDPQPGLVLHSWQIDWRARHQRKPQACPAKLRQAHKDIMARAARYKANAPAALRRAKSLRFANVSLTRVAPLTRLTRLRRPLRHPARAGSRAASSPRGP